jgi:hypothetical protein
MSIPQSEYKNQKCACFIEIDRLESQLTLAHDHIQNLQTTNGDLTRRYDMAREGLEKIAFGSLEQNFKEITTMTDQQIAGAYLAKLAQAKPS